MPNQNCLNSRASYRHYYLPTPSWFPGKEKQKSTFSVRKRRLTSDCLPLLQRPLVFHDNQIIDNCRTRKLGTAGFNLGEWNPGRPLSPRPEVFLVIYLRHQKDQPQVLYQTAIYAKALLLASPLKGQSCDVQSCCLRLNSLKLLELNTIRGCFDASCSGCPFSSPRSILGIQDLAYNQ